MFYDVGQDFKNHHYHWSLGLDVGQHSIGVATVQRDPTGQPIRIGERFVIIPYIPVEPKTQQSLKGIRGQVRRQRRTIRRAKHRRKRLRYLVVKYGLITATELQQLYQPAGLPDIYQLRVKALDEPLSNQELVRILFWMAQHRGFQSNARNQEQDPAHSYIKYSIQQITAALNNPQNSYRTLGELLFRDPRFAHRKHNRVAYNNQPVFLDSAHKIKVPADFLYTPARSLLRQELSLILKQQAQYFPVLNQVITVKHYTQADAPETLTLQEYLLDSVHGPIFGQRNFDDGPGTESGQSQYQKEIGRDPFNHQLRLAHASWTAAEFILDQKINLLQWRTAEEATFHPLTAEQRTQLQQLCLTAAKTPSYSQIATQVLGKKYAQVSFNLDVGQRKSTKFINGLDDFYALKEALQTIPDLVQQRAAFDEVARILLFFKTDLNRLRALQSSKLLQAYRTEFTEQSVCFQKLCQITGNKTVHLSRATILKLLPYLQAGAEYSQALQQAGLDARRVSLSLTDINNSITNPVVKQLVLQSIQIVDRLIKKYGSQPDYITVEMARDVAKTPAERQQITKQIKMNQIQKDKIRQFLQQQHAVVNDRNVLKMRLWQEQQECDFYQPQQKLSLAMVLSSQTEIDHIIPRSVSLDNSYSNKVLTTKRHNQEKGNRLPLQAFNAERQRQIANYAEQLLQEHHISLRKYHNLMQTEVSRQWTNQMLQDTRYATTVLADYLEVHKVKQDGQKRLLRPQGKITADLRSFLKLPKDRQTNYHHAVDALLLAALTPNFLQQLQDYYTQAEQGTTADTGPDLEHYFWTNFPQEIRLFADPDPQTRLQDDQLKQTILQRQVYPVAQIEQLQPIFIYYPEDRRSHGAMFKDSLYGSQYFDQGYLKTYVPVCHLVPTVDPQTGQTILRKGLDKVYPYGRKQNPVAQAGIPPQVFQAIVQNFQQTKQRLLQQQVITPTTSDQKVLAYLPETLVVNQQAIRTVPALRKSNNAYYNARRQVVQIPTHIHYVDLYQNQQQEWLYVPTYTYEHQPSHLICTPHQPRSTWKTITPQDHFQTRLYRYSLVRLAIKRDRQGDLTMQAHQWYYLYFVKFSQNVLTFSDGNNNQIRLSGQSLEKIAKVHPFTK